jgi:hypothetical protein
MQNDEQENRKMAFKIIKFIFGNLILKKMCGTPKNNPWNPGVLRVTF